MAGAAVCAQGTFVRILVAILATDEGNARIADTGFSSIRGGFFFVAFRAGSLAVRASQGELRSGVVETRNILPLCEGVALPAFHSHLAAMLILMACGALALQAEERSAEIPHANALPGVRRHVLGGVATLALQSGVSAFQWVARLSMIEFVDIHLPENRNKFPSVVL